MSGNVDTRVTLSLRPEVIEAIDGYDLTTAPYVATAHGAFKTAYTQIQQLHNARDALKYDPTKNEAMQIIETDRLKHDKIGRATKALDEANSDLTKKIDYTEALLSAPLQNTAASSVAREIRSHVKSLSASDRIDFLRHAISEGDEVTVASVLAAPPYLSGMTADAQKAHLRSWHEKHSPELAQRLKVMVRARELVLEHGDLIFPEMEKAVGVLKEPNSGRIFTARELREAMEKSQKAFRANA